MIAHTQPVAHRRARIALAGPRRALLEALRTELAGSETVDTAPLSESADSPDSILLAPRCDEDLASQLEAVGAAGAACAEHWVLISDARASPPSHHHPGHVREEFATQKRVAHPLARAWLRLEAQTAAAADRHGATLTVLRPCPVVLPGGRGFFDRLVRGRVGWTVAGFDPSIQLLSATDLARAVECAVATRRPGIFHVAPRGVAPLCRLLGASRTLRVPLPYTAHRLGRAVLARMGLAGAIAEVDYLRYPWSVSGDKIRRELGFRPLHDTLEAARHATATDTGSDKTPSPRYDDHGFDRDYVDRRGRGLFRFLHDRYWRVEVKGLEHVPETGKAVLVGIHRGHQPYDAVMALHLLATRRRRYPRFLIHPTLVKFPFLASFITRCGGLHACQENADWVLEHDRILGVFPEGIRGTFRRYRNAYRLGKFGRDEFVKIALRHQAPIIPFVTVGSAEIFPILGKLRWGWFKRATEWPCLPITPTMSTVPLPSKWHTWFLDPIPVAGRYPPEAVRDRATVRQISQDVRARLEAAIAEMLERRRSIFYGQIFDREAPA